MKVDVSLILLLKRCIISQLNMTCLWHHESTCINCSEKVMVIQARSW